jgi:hypothetical protein
MRFSQLTQEETEEIYSRLVSAAKRFETPRSNAQGVSDKHELANQAQLYLLENDIEMPEDLGDISAHRLVRAAFAKLTGGSAPSRKGQTGVLKYGKFEQQADFEKVSFDPQLHESDLEEAFKYVRTKMKTNQYLDLFHASTGLVHQNSIEEWAKLNGLSYDAGYKRIHRARSEFLSCIPKGSELSSYSRLLRTKYGVE